MNRTSFVVAVYLAAAGAVARAQDPPPPAAAKAQADPIDELVLRMVAAEKAIQSIVLELSTTGTLGGGASVSTKGSLRVARGTQGGIHQRVEYTFDDGVRGMAESAQTASGILLFEDDPVYGPVFVQLDGKLVADLEWAGEVLDADHLPGMRDRRARAPLGSALVAHAHLHFQLAARSKERAGEAGTWLEGSRKKGLDAKDEDLPVADAVQMFVRTRDLALLEVRWLQGDKVVQQLVVDKVQIDVDLPEQTFQVDGRGAVLKPVQQHQPLWETIEQTLRQAEAKREREFEAKQQKAKQEGRELPPEEKPEVRPGRR